jgi:hypothetical protein
MSDLNTFNGVAGGGVTLKAARAISDAGQIVGDGSNGHGYLLTLDTTVWEGGTFSSGSGTGWSYGIAPNKYTSVLIDPTVSVSLTGPSVNTDVRQLTVGGDSTGNNGIATLSLNGGTFNVLGNAGQFTTINAKGVLTGDGIINGVVSNLGTVNAVNLTLTGGLTNAGTVTGNGRLNTNLTNAAAGTVQLGADQTLVLSGAGGHTNSGLVDLSGGARLQISGNFVNNAGGQVSVAGSTARFDSAVTNAAGGRFQLNAATLRFNGGLTNNGRVQVSFGGAEVFGAVTTTRGGQVILSGNSDTTFYDAVDVQSGGELRVTTGSTAVFFGQVFQRTGALFTGSGTKFYEGGLSIGASPGLGIDAGDVNFGSDSQFLVEIGGTKACTASCATNDTLKNASFDKYIVAGHLSLGGTLKLVSWNGFVGHAGDSFDLLDWGSESGSFSAVDASALRLAPGTALDFSQLSVNGTVSVTAVPEPQTWALLMAGLCVTAAAARRRRLTR